MRDAPGEGLFIAACAACHSVGEGVRVGPDLAGVTLRRDRTWLEAFLMEPERMLALGDAAAVALDRQFPAVRMPDLGLSETDIEDLLSYLQTQTELIHHSVAKAEPSAQEHADNHAMHGAQQAAGSGSSHVHHGPERTAPDASTTTR